jgi:hypothetical protein
MVMHPTSVEPSVEHATTRVHAARARGGDGDRRRRGCDRGAVLDLGASFARARELAMTRRMPVAIAFDSAAGLVQIRGGGDTLVRKRLRRLYGVAIGANHDSVVYDPRGLGYGLSNLTVTVRRGSFVDTLRMSRLGRVRW